MLGALVPLALLVAAPPAHAGVPAAPIGQGAPAPELDATPSDALAIGFLEAAVDRRLYSLEAAGASKVTTAVHASVEGGTPQPIEVDLELSCDFSSGSISIRPTSQVSAEAQPLLPIFYANAQLATPILPSRVAGNFIVRFAQDGDLVRLAYTPRVKRSQQSTVTEWYQADGTPVRRQGVIVAPDGTKVTQDMKATYTEVAGRLLLKEWRPSEGAEGATLKCEYDRSGDFHVMKRLVQAGPQIRMTFDFTTKVEKKAPQ